MGTDGSNVVSQSPPPKQQYGVTKPLSLAEPTEAGFQQTKDLEKFQFGYNICKEIEVNVKQWSCLFSEKYVYIPEDIVSDILSRLPVKSVTRFKCVSKTWYRVIVSPDFIKKHLKKSKSNMKLIGEYSCKRRRKEPHPNPHTYDIRFTLGGEVSFSNMNKEIKYPDIFNNLKEEEKYIIIIAGSSNGLICLIYQRMRLQEGGEIIVLWNPSTGKHFRLPNRTDKLASYEVASYGFGYDETTNDYKVARLATYFISFSKFSIFSLKSNKWKNFEKEDFPFENYVFLNNDTVTVNGALHWLLTNKSILAFNLENNGFRLLPPPKTLTRIQYASLSVAFISGVQYLVYNDISAGQKWISTKDDDNNYSWTKLTSSVFSIGQQNLEVEYPVKVTYFKAHLYFESLVQFDDAGDKNDITFIEEQVGERKKRKHRGSYFSID